VVTSINGYQQYS
jgi:hypothetical protein